MKQKLIKFGLIFMTVFLLGSTIYITLLLNNTGPTTTTTVKKTKAASVTYTKTLALNTEPVQPEISETPVLSGPTVIPTEKLLSYNSINQTGQPTPKSTPSPTLSASTLSPTVSSTTQPTQTQGAVTVTPTGVASLPKSGWMQSSIVIFAAASIFIFLSFLY